MRLDVDACRVRFAAARHAYLGTADADGVPHLVPVTFALVSAAEGSRAEGGAGQEGRDEIVVAVDHKPKTTRDLKRLRNIAENPRVALLVDRYDDDWTHLWWVRADGVAAVEVAALEQDRGNQDGDMQNREKQDGDAQDGSEQDREARAAALDALAARYPQYRQRRPDGPLIRVHVTRWSGWAHG